MSAPSTGREWFRWACAQTHAQELDERQAHLLQLLAGTGNQHGEGFGTREELARCMVCSYKTISRVFAELVERGLVVRVGPQNRKLRWRLNTARQPAAQLTMDAPERDTSVSRQRRLMSRQMSRQPGHEGVPLKGEGTTTTPLTPQGGNSLPVGPGPRGRQSDRLADLEALRQHAAAIFRGADQELALEVVRAARGSGVHDHDDVRAFAREWYPQLEARVPA